MATDVHRDVNASPQSWQTRAAGRRGPGPRPGQEVRRPHRHHATSTWTSSPASSWCCWAPAAAARARCCGSSPTWTGTSPGGRGRHPAGGVLPVPAADAVEEGLAQRRSRPARQAGPGPGRGGAGRGRHDATAATSGPRCSPVARRSVRRWPGRWSGNRICCCWTSRSRALDALTRLTAQALVADLWALHQCAVLLVTHDVEESVKLADRVLVMKDGVIAHEARVDLPRPRDVTDPRFRRAAGRIARPPRRGGALMTVQRTSPTIACTHWRRQSTAAQPAVAARPAASEVLTGRDQPATSRSREPTPPTDPGIGCPATPLAVLRPGSVEAVQAILRVAECRRGHRGAARCRDRTVRRRQRARRRAGALHRAAEPASCGSTRTTRSPSCSRESSPPTSTPRPPNTV